MEFDTLKAFSDVNLEKNSPDWEIRSTEKKINAKVEWKEETGDGEYYSTRNKNQLSM